MKRFPAIRIALIFSLILNTCLLAALFLAYQSFHMPVSLDRSSHLAFNPGFTIPGRSLDAAGNGTAYHFTRYDSYNAPDWKPNTP